MGPFVGRQTEMKAWGEALAAPAGHCILVVGQQGMGKTMLLEKMAELAESHPNLRCGSVRYEVVPSDSFESVASLMMEDAYLAAAQTEGSFAPTERRRRQWKALFQLLPKGRELHELISSLRRDATLNVRVQLLERLQLISDRLPVDGRAVFFIDPEKYLNESSADAWRLLIRDLPPKCKVVLVQRTDGILATNPLFLSLPNIVRIPETELGVLEAAQVEELVLARSSEIAYDIRDVMAAIAKYRGHPYAVSAAIDLLSRKAADPASLSIDPTPEHIAANQWRTVCQHGPDAIRAFRAFAVLEAAAGLEMVSEVADIALEAVESLLADDFLRGLLREESSGYVIYHSLLSDYILGESAATLRELHERTVDAYRRRLWQIETAPIRLPWHLLSLHGDAGFVDGLNECAPHLLNRGLYDSFLEMAKRALDMVEEASPKRATLLSSVATAKLRVGNLDEAASLLGIAIKVCVNAGDLRGKALSLNQLAEIQQMRGNFAEAEANWSEALPTFESENVHAGITQCLNGLAAIDFARGFSDQAGEKYRRALNAAITSNDPSQIAISLANMAELHIRRGEYPEAVEKLRDGLKLFEKGGYSEGTAGVLSKLGWIYRQQGKFDEALTAHRQALKIGTDSGHPTRMAEESASLSWIYLTLGDLDQAESMIRAALDLERGLGLSAQVAERYSTLGRIYHARNDFKMAKFMAGSSLAIFKKLGDLEAIATELANLGATLHSAKNLPEARAAYEQVLQISERINRPDLRAFAIGNIGALHRQAGNWDQSLQAHNEALAYFERIGNPMEVAIQKENLGRLAACRGEACKAIETLEEVLAAYQKLGITQRVASVAAILASLRLARPLN